jgi:hypothetical protein
MIVDPKGNMLNTMDRAIADAIKAAQMELSLAIYGDGGPLIVSPDWKPSKQTQMIGLSKILP